MTPQGDARGGGPWGVPVSWPTTPASLFPSAPSPASQQEDTNEDKWLLYKVSISDSSILYRVGHAPPSTAFSIAPQPPNKVLGKVKNPPLHTLLPTTNLLLFLFETCSSVSVYHGCTRRGGGKDWGDKLEILWNQPWKWGGNVKGYSRCANPIFLSPQISKYVRN